MGDIGGVAGSLAEALGILVETGRRFAAVLEVEAVAFEVDHRGTRFAFRTALERSHCALSAAA